MKNLILSRDNEDWIVITNTGRIIYRSKNHKKAKEVMQGKRQPFQQVEYGIFKSYGQAQLAKKKFT